MLPPILKFKQVNSFESFFTDVPNAPSGVRLSNIKSRSVEVSWVGQHDGNSMVLNYVVEYSNIPGALKWQSNTQVL